MKAYREAFFNDLKKQFEESYESTVETINENIDKAILNNLKKISVDIKINVSLLDV